MQTNINNKIEWIRNFFFVSRKNGADKIGVTANYLCQLEAGVKAPRLRALCKFSAAYGIPLDVLYSDERIFLLFAIESLNSISDKRAIDKLIQGLQILQQALKNQEQDSQADSENKVNRVHDWINTGGSQEAKQQPNDPQKPQYKPKGMKHKNNIAKYRRRQGYTQATLSEIAGISSHYQTELETTNKIPSADLLKKLSKILKTPMFFIYQSKLDYKDFNIHEQLEQRPKPGNLLKLAKLYHVPYDLFLSNDEKYFKLTAIKLLIDTMNTREKEDLMNLLLHSIMRDKERLTKQ